MTPTQQIDKYIASLPTWQSELLAWFRELVNDEAPEATEDWKWEVPVWTYNGMLCAMSAFKAHVKFNFLQGAELEDKHKLFNSGLDSKKHRGVDLREGETVDEEKLRGLIRKAGRFNREK